MKKEVKSGKVETLSMSQHLLLVLYSSCLYQKKRVVQLDLNTVLLLLDEKLCTGTVVLKSQVNWIKGENCRCYLPEQSFVQ